MVESLRRNRGIVLLVLIGLLMVLGYQFGSDSRLQTLVQVHQDPPTATGTAVFPDPIYDEQDAIARSMAQFPAGLLPHSAVARLVTMAAFDLWAGISGEPETDPSDPVWLVGILADDIVVEDVVDLAIELPEGFELNDDRPAEGAFYAWGANSGVLFAQGALLAGSPRNYTALTDLPIEVLTVVPATYAPTWTPAPGLIPEAILTLTP